MEISRERRGRIRAMRSDDVNAQLERRLTWLGFGRDWQRAGTNPALAQRLARALRRERRIRNSGVGSGYDPLRHLVLLRLARLMQRRPGRCDLADITCGGTAAGRDPFSSPARNALRRSSEQPSGSRRGAPTLRDIARATFRSVSSDDGAAT